MPATFQERLQPHQLPHSTVALVQGRCKCGWSGGAETTGQWAKQCVFEWCVARPSYVHRRLLGFEQSVLYVSHCFLFIGIRLLKRLESAQVLDGLLWQGKERCRRCGKSEWTVRAQCYFCYADFLYAHQMLAAIVHWNTNVPRYLKVLQNYQTWGWDSNYPSSLVFSLINEHAALMNNSFWKHWLSAGL